MRAGAQVAAAAADAAVEQAGWCARGQSRACIEMRGSGLVRTRASVRGSTSYPHGCRDLAVRVLTSCEL